MNGLSRAFSGWPLLAAVAFGQTPAAPLVQIAPTATEATLLTANAAGVTEVRLDSIAPTATRLSDAVSERVANLHSSDGSTRSFGDVWALRGVSNTLLLSDPSVAVYFDDLPIGGVFSYPTGLFGFNSATIRRGPQGTALGRGAEAGAITFSSTEPGASATGELRASAGNFQMHSLAVDARSARGEKADATVSAAWVERDGYRRNASGARSGDQNAHSIAARARIRPSATTELTLQFLGNRLRHDAPPLVPLGAAILAAARGPEDGLHNDFVGGAFKAAFELPLGRLSSTTSHTHGRLSQDDRLAVPPEIDSRIDRSERIWNQELRLASPTQSLIGWHVGAWFSDTATDGELSAGALGSVPAAESRLNARTSALFGAVTIPPNIGWSVTAGLRLEETERDWNRTERALTPGSFSGSRTFRSAQPKLSASYVFPNNVTASAAVAWGAKPGGWSAYTGDSARAAFRAERLAAFEAGLDASLAQNTLALATRVFAYAIRDYQFARSSSPTDYLVVNAARARSLGMEAEAAWKPTPRWTLIATLGATDVQFRRFTDPFTGRSYDGKRAPYTPGYEAHLATIYRAKNGLFAAAEVTATGKTFHDEEESAAFAAAAHTLAHIRTGYETVRWRLTFFVQNIADARYTSLVIPAVRHATPGAPRRWGVEAAVKW